MEKFKPAIPESLSLAKTKATSAWPLVDLISQSCKVDVPVTSRLRFCKRKAVFSKLPCKENDMLLSIKTSRVVKTLMRWKVVIVKDFDVLRCCFMLCMLRF